MAMGAPKRGFCLIHRKIPLMRVEECVMISSSLRWQCKSVLGLSRGGGEEEGALNKNWNLWPEDMKSGSGGRE